MECWTKKLLEDQALVSLAIFLCWVEQAFEAFIS